MLTDDDETDYQFVRSKVNELRKKFSLVQLGFDDTYAAQLAQRLRDEDGMSPDSQLKIPQTMMAFTAGTVAYENLLIEDRLHHNANKVLTWQAGTVKVKSDANQNIRPVKQKHGDYRTIDGIVAGIMALSLALQPKKQSVYESRGVLSVGDGDLGASSRVPWPTANNWQEI